MRSFTFLSAIALTFAGFACAAPAPINPAAIKHLVGDARGSDVNIDVRDVEAPPHPNLQDMKVPSIPIPRDIEIKSLPALLKRATIDLEPVLDDLVNLDVDELTVEVLRPITDRVTLILEVLLKGVNNLVGRPIKEVLRTADGAVMTVEQLASRVAEFLILVLRTIATLLKHTLLEEVAAILRGITTLVNDVLIAILKLVVGLDVAIVPFIGDLLDVLSSVGIKISL
ncbi:hypothetical protein DL96DRAFT_1555246 [Flagelloscypha sp. PMI_526]|nr:hypothetical protein DL96DRAFT_1555246 [Flagelloscypha sp. PMI_526]